MRTVVLAFLSAVLAFVLVVPGARATITLTSEGGFVWDIAETSYGYFRDGTSNAYDNCYRLRVDGSSYYSYSTPATTMDGRQIEMGVDTLSSLQVRRMIYVPSTGGDWARVVDVFENPGTTAITATLSYKCDLGANSSSVVVDSSSGDDMVDPSDFWAVTDEGVDGSGSPALGHLFQGSGALHPTSTAVFHNTDDLEWGFTATVPAGGRVVLVTYAVQANDRATATAEATRLAGLPADALAGIESLEDDIVNFAPGGAPIVSLAGPTSADEGEELTFEVSVEDREGDAATWAWDTDGDGLFEERVDETTYTIPAGTTDGDDVLRVGVQASDGTETRQRFWDVSVRNLDPTITSAAPTPPIFIGTMYRYEPTATDPGGSADPLTFTLLRGPEGISIDDSNVITWTARPDQRDTTFEVEMIVEDDDGGSATETWSLSVGNNRVPAPPTPLSPIDRVMVEETLPTLVVANGADEDGDELTYHFQIDRVSSYDSAALRESPPVVEMAEQTVWTVPSALAEGTWYWQVWVSDGLAESQRMNGVFVVGGDTEDPDVGVRDGGVGGDGRIAPPPGSGGREGGCSVGTTGTTPSALWLVLGVVALLVRRRRI